MADNLGLVHIYYGDGKGKTSAAIGLAIRAAGHGLNVLILQLLKTQYTGELNILDNIPNIRILRGKGVSDFSFSMTDEQKKICTATHNYNLGNIIEDARGGSVDLLILDEVIGAYNRELLDRRMLINFIKNKPAQMELVLTGRNPPPELLELADYASEIKKIKHPFDNGIGARLGIER